MEFGLKTPRVPIEDSFDLHSFRPEDVRDALEDYLEAAREKGYREVRIIHGKGKGVRRAEVRQWLSSHPFIADYSTRAPSGAAWARPSSCSIQNPKSKIKMTSLAECDAEVGFAVRADGVGFAGDGEGLAADARDREAAARRTAPRAG